MQLNERREDSAKDVFPPSKIFLVMKLTILLVTIACFQVVAGASAQKKITLHERNASLSKVITLIKNQSDYAFFYDEEIEKAANTINAELRNVPLDQALAIVFKNQPLVYTIVDHTVVITKKPVSELLVSIQVQGTITDEKGGPLGKVTIREKGTKSVTVSDGYGHYAISVTNARAILIYSFISYAPQEIQVNGKSIIDVQLKENTTGLNEVMVVGYGSIRKRDITGAIATVKINDEETAQISSVDKLLQGRAAGVTVTSGSAAPGGAVNVRIRGTGTFTGGSEPLYVVDGVIINTATQDVDNSLKAGTNSGNSYQESQDGLTAINPQDIESMEVLKDASATAIYGSRGANGVVLITTKHGKTSKGVIAFSSTNDFATVRKKLPVLDGRTFVQYKNEENAMQEQAPAYNLNTIQPINWQDDIFRTGITTNDRLTFSGANDKGDYYLALGYLKNDGIIPTSGVKQGDLRFNATQNISNRLKISSRTGLTYRRNSMTQATEQLGSASNSIMRSMLSKEPILDTIGPSQADIDADIEGPRAWLQDYDDLSNEFRVIQSLALDYKLTDAFTFHVLGGADIRSKDRHRWFGKALGQGKAANGQLGYSALKNQTYNLEGMLFYNKTYGKHRINATIGSTYDASNIVSSYTVNEDFFTEDLRTNGLGTGARLFPYFENYSNTSILSGLGRIVYSYNDRYILTATGRADGTSLFADGNKWGFFPSLAFAWRASDEPFIKELNLFSTLKPRIGYGVTGNQAISPYQTVTRYSAAYYASDNGTITVGAKPSLIANKDLTWESTRQLNIGVDAGFLNDRLNFTVDLYDKKTKNLLQQISLPTSTGFTSMYINRGAIQNKGLEFAVDGVISRGKIGWTAGANITFNRNKITDTGLPQGQFGNMNLSAFLGSNVAGGNEFKMPANIFADGYPVGMFFGYQTKGIYQASDVTNHPLKLAGTPLQPGDIYFVDQNGDGNISDADKVIIGNPNPKFTYGFSSTVTYKQFAVSVFVNGVYGNQIANGNRLKIEDTQAGTNVINYAYTQAWTPAQPNNPYPRLLYKNGDFTDRILEDGSYLRLGMLTFSYKMNVSKLKFISGLDLFITGHNLLTLTNYTGFDPEVNSFTNDPLRMGVDWSSYPTTRSFTAGFNVKF